MGVNSLPKTVTRQRRGCDLNPGPSAPESSTLTTRLPSRPNTQPTKMPPRSNAGRMQAMTAVLLILHPPPSNVGGGVKRHRDPSVFLSHGAAALGYSHASCLQLQPRADCVGILSASRWAKLELISDRYLT